MPLIDDTDNAIIFDALGDAVTIVFDDGSDEGLTVSGIFVEPFESVGSYDGQVETTLPSLRVAAADVADLSIEHDLQVSVSGVGYKVVAIQPDNEGWVALNLREV